MAELKRRTGASTDGSAAGKLHYWTGTQITPNNTDIKMVAAGGGGGINIPVDINTDDSTTWANLSLNYGGYANFNIYRLIGKGSLSSIQQPPDNSPASSYLTNLGAGTRYSDGTLVSQLRNRPRFYRYFGGIRSLRTDFPEGTGLAINSTVGTTTPRPGDEVSYHKLTSTQRRRPPVGEFWLWPSDKHNGRLFIPNLLMIPTDGGNAPNLSRGTTVFQFGFRPTP